MTMTSHPKRVLDFVASTPHLVDQFSTWRGDPGAWERDLVGRRFADLHSLAAEVIAERRYFGMTRYAGELNAGSDLSYQLPTAICRPRAPIYIDFGQSNFLYEDGAHIEGVYVSPVYGKPEGTRFTFIQRDFLTDCDDVYRLTESAAAVVGRAWPIMALLERREAFQMTGDFKTNTVLINAAHLTCMAIDVLRHTSRIEVLDYQTPVASPWDYVSKPKWKPSVFRGRLF